MVGVEGTTGVDASLPQLAERNPNTVNRQARSNLVERSMGVAFIRFGSGRPKLILYRVSTPE